MIAHYSFYLEPHFNYEAYGTRIISVRFYPQSVNSGSSYNIINKTFKNPRTIVLIFAGLVAATFPRIAISSISPQIFTTILLPPILFEAALSLDIKYLVEDVDIIFSYAILGTLITLVAVSSLTYFVFRYSFIEAIIIGIIVSPTDPVAVITTFKREGVSEKFKTIVEGEALFNDGVAIVAYSLILSTINQGSFTVYDISKSALTSNLGGIGLGVSGGYIVHFLIKSTDDKFAEVLLGFLLSFGVYRLAEELGASGVIATVVAGLMINYRIANHGGLSSKAAEELEVFWEFIGFIATSFAFIFVGINLKLELLVSYFLPILILTIFILITRYLKIFGIARVIENIRGKSIPRNWRIGLWWSGIRGAISIVLVLTISSLNLTHVEEMKALTFGLVLATNLVWGVTISYAIKKYDLIEK